MMFLEQLKQQAETYASQSRLDLSLKIQLGYGNDGAVWSTIENTAIKAFERQANYSRELACYERLLQFRVSSLGEFAVPSLFGQDRELLVLEISIVQPPYVLDFGKAYLDTPPDFSEEVIADWERERSSLFEQDQWVEVKALLGQLSSLGIYYFDAKPANIAFT